MPNKHVNIQQAIGLLGGSFDPVHHGHLRSAIDVADLLNLQSIYLLPNFRSPHKTANQSSNQHRLDMLRLATSDCEQLEVDEQEITVPGASYTVDTLQSMRQQHPNRPLCFLMGMDSLLSFTTWHRWQDILSLCHLVVSSRPGWSLPLTGDIVRLLTDHRTDDVNDLQRRLAGHIFIHEAHPLSISSSEIRQLRQQNKSCQFLLPKNVNDYLIKHQLYQASQPTKK